MAGKIYKDDVGVIIRVETELDLTSAATYTLEVWKPNGVKVSWAPTVVSPATAGILTYTTGSTDLNQEGTYKLQAKVTFTSPSKLYRGETATFKVYDYWD